MAEEPKKVPDFFTLVLITLVLVVFVVAAFAVDNPAGINETAAPIPNIAVVFNNLLLGTQIPL